MSEVSQPEPTGADGRVLSVDVGSMALGHEPVSDVLEGDPSAGARILGAVRGVEVGVWELTVGTVRDTEVDEIFVVLSGRGSVVFEDGERVSLSPGVAVRLTAGERTTWTITQTLRKLWVA